MKTRIRAYQDDDFQEINLLWKLTAMGGEVRGDSKSVIRNSLQTGGQLFILEEEAERKIIGTSWLTYDGRRLYLHHFAIHPDWQGKGFSKALLKVSLDFAKKSNTQIKLEVHKDNEIAISLYKKYGFKYLGDYDVYIIRRFDDLQKNIEKN